MLLPIDAGVDQQEVSGGRLGGKRKRPSLESPELDDYLATNFTKQLSQAELDEACGYLGSEPQTEDEKWALFEKVKDLQRWYASDDKGDGKEAMPIGRQFAKIGILREVVVGKFIKISSSYYCLLAIRGGHTGP